MFLFFTNILRILRFSSTFMMDLKISKTFSFPFSEGGLIVLWFFLKILRIYLKQLHIIYLLTAVNLIFIDKWSSFQEGFYDEKINENICFPRIALNINSSMQKRFESAIKQTFNLPVVFPDQYSKFQQDTNFRSILHGRIKLDGHFIALELLEVIKEL